MIQKMLSRQFELNFNVLLMNTDGLSHEDSLIQPPNGGNNLNWILGHILSSRNRILEKLSEEKVWDEAKEKLYDRGTSSIDDSSATVSLDELLKDMEKSQDRILSGIKNLNTTDEELVKKIAFLQFHESYHVGQTGILRRIIGKEGAIK